MEAREEDVDVELAWKAALVDDTFAKLSEADLGYASHAASCMGQEQARPRLEAATQRFKRKNFSKQLQLMCLQRYAQYARDFGRLPGKQETKQILDQSHVQFLKEGGASDEPRLTHAEFLKLIRNRRREINARAQRPPKQSTDDQVAATSLAVLTPAKRKLQEEHNKIRELIEVIDRAREQAGLIPDVQQQNRRVRTPQTAMTQGHPQPTAVEMVMVPPPPMMESLPPLPPDPMEQMEAILQIHQETLEVQREIAVRLRSISRVIHQHEGHGEMEEPSSASV